MKTPSPEPPSRNSNPFATCWTRPGALPWCDADGAPLGVLVERLLGQKGVWQIIGEHGSGKSTLLRRLADAIGESGLGARLVDAADQIASSPTNLLLVEGFERLSRHDQATALRRWRHRRAWVVVTTHRALPRVPSLITLAPSEALIAVLFERLIAGRHTPVTPGDALRCWRRRRDDVRELWFDLYDLHELRTRVVRNTASSQAFTVRDAGAMRL